MKRYLRLPILTAHLIIAAFVLSIGSVIANDDLIDNYIIITGQITDNEYGIPLKGHPVYIKTKRGVGYYLDLPAKK